MITSAQAHQHGVHVTDENGTHYIPFQRRPRRLGLHADPAPEPEGTDSTYQYFDAPMRHSVLPADFALSSLFVRKTR